MILLGSQEWGEGGEAKLRRLPDGSFDLLTSARRGGASSGYGTPLNSLSDGARLDAKDRLGTIGKTASGRAYVSTHALLFG